jgi:hypothetical protein
MNRLSVLVALLFLVALPAAADDVYVGTSNGDFGVLNTTTQSFTLIGNNGVELYGMGFSGGTLYANDNNGAPNTGFYSVNTSNGALTLIGDITSGSVSGTGAVLAPIGGGTLFYYDHSNSLYTVNPATGAATLIGPLGFTVAGSWDAAFAQNGNLYATSNENFYLINQSTGAGTFLGDSGVELQSIIAADGGMYGFSGSAMYSINLSTGALTFVGDTPSDIGSVESGVEVPSVATPEPGSMFNLLFGLALVGAFALLHRSRAALL